MYISIRLYLFTHACICEYTCAKNKLINNNVNPIKLSDSIFSFNKLAHYVNLFEKGLHHNIIQIITF